MSFSILWAQDISKVYRFENSCKFVYFIIVESEYSHRLDFDRRNQCFSCPKESKLAPFLLDDLPLSNERMETVFFDLQSFINVNFHKVTCHKQHCSYCLVVEKNVCTQSTDDIMYNILLDPGHGGIDPGACMGPIKEKDITLSVSRLLKRQLEFAEGLTVSLTRNNDDFLSLKERVYLAEVLQPDLFISLHADTYTDSEVSGASVYIWGDSHNPDRLNQHLLRFNDDKDYLGLTYDLDDKSLYPLLSELVQKLSYHNAHLLGTYLLASMEKVGSLHSQEPQCAPFYVIRPRSYPSVLIEMGFLSHEASANLLANSEYQTTLATSISHALKKFINFTTSNVVDTNLKKDIQYYLVRPGDTLWSLAKTYNLSVQSLKNLNDLHHDSLYVGQLLIVDK